MSRTNGQLQMKTPFSDGVLVLPANQFQPSGGAAAWTRNAQGSYSLNQAASLNVIFVGSLANALLRTGQAPFLQEQFGTSAGVAGPTSVANTSDPDGNVLAPYYPPMLKATLETVTGGEAGYVPKGMQINDITLHYFIGTNALTTHTIGLVKSVMPVSGTPAAITVTTPLAVAANGLATAANANPQTTKVAIATPAFAVSDLSQYAIEVNAVTPAGGTYELFGATIHVSFNFN